MKKLAKTIVLVAAIGIIGLNFMVQDINVNQHGIMFTFADDSGYWFEF